MVIICKTNGGSLRLTPCWQRRKLVASFRCIWAFVTSICSLGLYKLSTMGISLSRRYAAFTRNFQNCLWKFHGRVIFYQGWISKIYSSGWRSEVGTNYQLCYKKKRFSDWEHSKETFYCKMGYDLSWNFIFKNTI